MVKLLATSTLVALTVASYDRTANAATIAASRPDSFGRTFVDIKGEIFPRDQKTFASLIGAKPDTSRVIVRLNSPGGEFVAGMDIATTVLDKQLNTFVPDNANCASMCAIIWLAGANKLVTQTSAIGFRNIWEGTGQASGSGNAMLGSFLGRLGYKYDAINWMTEKPANGFNWLSQDVANKYGVKFEYEPNFPKPISTYHPNTVITTSQPQPAPVAARDDEPRLARS